MFSFGLSLSVLQYTEIRYRCLEAAVSGQCWGIPHIPQNRVVHADSLSQLCSFIRGNFVQTIEPQIMAFALSR